MCEQPALLYLVPCTLGVVCAVAYYRGHLSQLWTGAGMPQGRLHVNALFCFALPRCDADHSQASLFAPSDARQLNEAAAANGAGAVAGGAANANAGAGAQPHGAARAEAAHEHEREASVSRSGAPSASASASAGSDSAASDSSAGAAPADSRAAGASAAPSRRPAAFTIEVDDDN